MKKQSTVEADTEEVKSQSTKPAPADSPSGGRSKKAKRLIGGDGLLYLELAASFLLYGNRGLIPANTVENFRMMVSLERNHCHA